MKNYVSGNWELTFNSIMVYVSSIWNWIHMYPNSIQTMIHNAQNYWKFFPLLIKPQLLTDIAATKRHQRLDELLLFFTRTIRKISRFLWENSVRNEHIYNKRMLYETCAFITSVCYRCKHDCIKFCGRIAWHSFLENNFAELLDEVRVKINRDFVQLLLWGCLVTATSATHRQ